MILHQKLSKNAPGAGQEEIPAANLHLWRRAKACKPHGASVSWKTQETGSARFEIWQ